MSRYEPIELIAHSHPPDPSLKSCHLCTNKICETCSFSLKSSSSQQICEHCHILSIKSSGHVLDRLHSSMESLALELEKRKNQLGTSKVLKAQARSAYLDLESSKQMREQQKTLLEKTVFDLENEIRAQEVKIEKYRSSLLVSTTKTNMIMADRDRINMEYEECNKRINEFQEMIKEQDEENFKMKEEIEKCRIKGDVSDDRKHLNEVELKRRLSKLQVNIDKVRNSNQTLEYQIKVLNDEDRLKSGTISVLSEKVSFISGSQLGPKEVQSNELVLKMKNQLEQTMKLYKEINQIKMKKQEQKAKLQEISSSHCKCLIN